jgi:glucose-1-phosphate thymidylyltransferase
VEEGAVVRKSVVRGPSYIGRGTLVEESYVGPYTSVGEGCKLVRVEVENSVLMDRVELSNLNVRVFNSLIGSDAVVRGGEGRPRGLKLILGGRSRLDLLA